MATTLELFSEYGEAAQQPETGAHHCHWPGCTVAVHPSFWGCRAHWLALPRPIRQAIWHAYRRGQEITKDPSDEYIAAARAAREWIHAQAGLARVATGESTLSPKAAHQALDARAPS